MVQLVRITDDNLADDIYKEVTAVGVDFFSSDKQYLWAITFRGEIVGLVSLYNISRTSADLGYWIKKTARRQGYAKQAVAQVVFLAAHDLGLQTIHAVIRSDNFASVSVIRANGFELRLKMGAYCEYVLKLASKKAGK